MLVGLASIFWIVKSSGFFYIGGLRRDFCFRLGDGPFVVPKRSSQRLPNFGEGKLFWRLSSNAAHRERGMGCAREKNSVAGEGEGRERGKLNTYYSYRLSRFCARAVFSIMYRIEVELLKSFYLTNLVECDIIYIVKEMNLYGN